VGGSKRASQGATLASRYALEPCTVGQGAGFPEGVVPQLLGVLLVGGSFTLTPHSPRLKYLRREDREPGVCVSGRGEGMDRRQCCVCVRGWGECVGGECVYVSVCLASSETMAMGRLACAGEGSALP
jgi:hypothetical protein